MVHCIVSRHAGVAVALSLALSACGGRDDTTAPDDNTTGAVRTITMSVNGTAVTASVVSGAWNAGQFVIGGTFGSSGSLSINANNFPSPGTYQLGAGNSGTALAQWIDGTGSYSTLATGGSGTLTLTTASLAHIKGTFSFTAATNSSGQSSTVVITNGAFEVKLQ